MVVTNDFLLLWFECSQLIPVFLWKTVCIRILQQLYPYYAKEGQATVEKVDGFIQGPLSECKTCIEVYYSSKVNGLL